MYLGKTDNKPSKKVICPAKGSDVYFPMKNDPCYSNYSNRVESNRVENQC